MQSGRRRLSKQADPYCMVIIPWRTNMKMLIVGLSAMSAFAATVALADDTTLINQMNMQPLSKSQSMVLRTERDSAREQWAKMTPEEQAAVKKAAAEKKTGDLSAIERIGQNDDMMAMTKSESAQAKAAREAAQAKWKAMSPGERDEVRKVAQQKKLSDLDDLERVGERD